MSRIIHLSIPLPPKGKARPIVTRHNTYMPHDYQQWRREFAAHAREQARGNPALGWFAIGLTVGTPKGRMRPDLDNVLAAVLDALQDAEVIANDRMCWEVMHVRRAKTKAKEYALSIELHSVELEAV